MIEITASDIFWIGAMDKITIGLVLMGLLTVFLLICSIHDESVALSLFFAFLGLACFIGFIFTPSSKTLAAMKVLPAIVNNQRIQGVAENALELTESFRRCADLSFFVIQQRRKHAQTNA